jgi:hypothetical protein
MNQRIMKLSVLVVIPVMALFIMVGMASADPRYSIHRYTIQGVYAVTGISQCDFGAPSVEEADFIFRHDGTGSIRNGVIRNLPPGPVLTMTAEFEYTVNKEGRIEITYPQAGLVLSLMDGPYLMTWDGGPSHGVISPDHKTITISCGPPVVLTLIDSAPLPGNPPEGATASCMVSLTGVRIK